MGINALDDPSEIAINELADAQNIEIDDKTMYQRAGYTEHREDLGEDAALGFYEHTEEDGTRYLIKVVDGVFYYDDGADWTVIALPVSYTITAGLRWHFFTYRDVTYCSNGTDNVLALTGASPGFTEKPDMVKFVMSVVYKNRVYVRDNTDKQRIKYTEIDDVETFPVNNIVDIDPRAAGDNQITALSSLYGQIVAFKTRSIHTYGGPNTKVTPVLWGVGCINQDVVTFDGNSSLIFADYDGVYATNLVSIVRLSDKVQTIFDARNFNNETKVVAIFHQHKYRLAFTHEDDTTNSRELVYDVRYGWVKTKGINVSWYVEAVFTNEHFLMFADSRNAMVHRMGKDPELVTSDNGVAIESFGVTALIDFGIPEVRKKVKKGYCHLDDSGNYNLKMGYRFDVDGSYTEEEIPLVNPSTSLWDDGLFPYDDGGDWESGGGSIDKYFFIAAGKRRRIQLRAYMSGTANFWRLYHIGLPYRQDRRFK